MNNSYRMAFVKSTADGKTYWAIIENSLDDESESIIEKYETRGEAAYWFLKYYEV